MHRQHVKQTNTFDCVDNTQTGQFELLNSPLDDVTFVGFGDCGWCVRRYGSSQSGKLIHIRILDGFERTTMVDWKSYTCKRVVRNSLAGETQAHVETLNMLELAKVFHALFLDPWKNHSESG